MTAQELWALGNFYKSVFSGEQIDEAIAFILNGGVNAAVLEAEAAAAAAKQSATEAAGSATELEVAVRDAQSAARLSDSGAKTAESYAVGGTGTREGEDTDNAKYYAALAASAAGGGVAAVAGVLPDETGNVPLTSEKLGAIPTTAKGEPNGVAELDAEGKVPTEQLPETMTPSAHAETHKADGSDPLTAADVGGVTEKRAVVRLESVGWYRIARFVGTAAASQAIVMLGTSYSNNQPFGLVALVSANVYRPSITVLQASSTVIFTALRLVNEGDGNTYLEAYYSATGNNPVAATLYNGYVTYDAYPVEFEASTASEEDVVLTQEIRSIPNGNVLTDGDSLYGLLWENASPKSEFAAQTVNLDLSNYGAAIVVFSKEPEQVSWYTAEFIVKNTRADVNVGYYASLHRRYVDVTNTAVGFSDCTVYPTYNSAAAGTTNNKRLVPVLVYGIKGVQ